MEFTNTRIVQITAGLLLMLVVTKALFIVFFMANVGIPRQLFLQSQPVVLLWGLEGLLFTALAAFAGAACRPKTIILDGPPLRSVLYST